MSKKTKATIIRSQNGFSGISDANRKNVERGFSGIGSANKKTKDTSSGSDKSNTDK
ncbi:MAG: hypothetical protein GQ570_14150 [Helicobacteraceae bacterium]|nr:hypothetical protein [Helicobacteraceae bacterium]